VREQLVETMRAMEALTGRKMNIYENLNVNDFVMDGEKMTKFTSMSPLEASKFWKMKHEEEETEISISEEVHAFPLDGAFALKKVLEKEMGTAVAKAKAGFFGPIPPTLRNIETGFGKQEQVIWGNFSVPGIEGGEFETGVAWGREGQPVFVIRGTAKKKYQKTIKMLADKVREYVKEHSVYKGKALRLFTDDEGNIDMDNPPAFMDTSKTDPGELIFSREIEEEVKTTLFYPIQYTDKCRHFKFPLKRGILFEGKYGTGKTLTANVTAKLCEETAKTRTSQDERWTFIYVDKATAVKQAMIFARHFSPAVVFAEDIDRATSGGRTVKVDDIMNNVDGVDSKNQDIILILTTNYVENIDPGMKRPGRIDSIITVTPPDAEAVERLLRLYGRGYINESEDLTAAAKALEGQIPAVIREAVEKSKLYRIADSVIGQPMIITCESIVKATKSMEGHLLHMKPKELPDPTPQQLLSEGFTRLVAGEVDTRVTTDFKPLRKQVGAIHERIVN